MGYLYDIITRTDPETELIIKKGDYLHYKGKAKDFALQKFHELRISTICRFSVNGNALQLEIA